MDERFDVLGIQLECPLELTQRALPLPKQGEGYAEEMMDVGEGTSRVHHRLEQVDGSIVVLHDKSLPGPCQQELSLPGHKPPDTIERNGEHPPETAFSACSRALRWTW